MKKITKFLLVASIIGLCSCAVDLPSRVFDGMKNDAVLKNVKTTFSGSVFAGDSFTFSPVFTAAEKDLFNAIEMKIKSGVGEVIATQTLVKPGAAEVKTEVAKGAEPEKPAASWGKISFDWAPKGADGQPLVFGPDAYTYIVTVYDKYQEPAKGKYTFEGAQKRVFVYKFELDLKAKIEVLTIEKMPKDIDTGISNLDGVTKTNTDMVFRAILNADPEKMGESGMTYDEMMAANLTFLITGPEGNEFKSPVQTVANPTATVADFADLGITDVTEGIANLRFFKYVCPETLPDGNYSVIIKMVNGSKNETTSKYEFTVDTVAPIVVWDYLLEGNAVVKNEGKKVAAETDKNIYPTYNWNFYNTVFRTEEEKTIAEAQQADFKKWAKFKFLDGTKPAKLNPDAPLVKGTNFDAITANYPFQDFAFDPWCGGLQEIEVDAYDIAGNKAVAAEGSSEVVKRRLEVKLPVDMFSPQIVNGDFEKSKGMSGEGNPKEAKSKNLGTTPGWKMNIWTQVCWSEGNIFNRKWNANNVNFTDAGPYYFQPDNGKGAWPNMFIAGTINNEKGHNSQCFKFKERTNSGDDWYNNTWGTLQQDGLKVYPKVTYNVTALVKNGPSSFGPGSNEVLGIPSYMKISAKTQDGTTADSQLQVAVGTSIEFKNQEIDVNFTDKSDSFKEYKTSLKVDIEGYMTLLLGKNKSQSGKKYPSGVMELNNNGWTAFDNISFAADPSSVKTVNPDIVLN